MNLPERIFFHNNKNTPQFIFLGHFCPRGWQSMSLSSWTNPEIHIVLPGFLTSKGGSTYSRLDFPAGGFLMAAAGPQDCWGCLGGIGEGFDGDSGSWEGCWILVEWCQEGLPSFFGAWIFTVGFCTGVSWGFMGPSADSGLQASYALVDWSLVLTSTTTSQMIQMMNRRAMIAADVSQSLSIQFNTDDILGRTDCPTAGKSSSFSGGGKELPSSWRDMALICSPFRLPVLVLAITLKSWIRCSWGGPVWFGAVLLQAWTSDARC